MLRALCFPARTAALICPCLPRIPHVCSIVNQACDNCSIQLGRLGWVQESVHRLPVRTADSGHAARLSRCGAGSCFRIGTPRSPCSSDGGAWEAMARPERPTGKLYQHIKWFDFLTAHGWTVHYYPVVVTHSGRVLDTATEAPTECGASPHGAAQAVRGTALNALQYDVKFKRARNFLQHQQSARQHEPG